MFNKSSILGGNRSKKNPNLEKLGQFLTSMKHILVFHAVCKFRIFLIQLFIIKNLKIVHTRK